MPRLKHFDYTGTARFITFNCYRNEPSLLDEDARRILAQFLEQTRQKYSFRLLSYVFMPEHVHLVIHPVDGTPVGKVVREIKSLSVREWFRLKEGAGAPPLAVGLDSITPIYQSPTANRSCLHTSYNSTSATHLVMLPNDVSMDMLGHHHVTQDSNASTFLQAR